MRTLWFFHFILDNDNLFLSKIMFYRPMFLRKSSKYSSTRLAQSFSVILTFFTHIVLSSVFFTEDVEEQVCPVLLQLTAGESNDDYRSEAVAVSF